MGLLANKQTQRQPTLHQRWAISLTNQLADVMGKGWTSDSCYACMKIFLRTFIQKTVTVTCPIEISTIVMVAATSLHMLTTAQFVFSLVCLFEVWICC